MTFCHHDGAITTEFYPTNSNAEEPCSNHLFLRLIITFIDISYKR